MRARVQTVLDNYARTQLDLYRPSFRFFNQAPSRLHTAPSVSRDFFLNKILAIFLGVEVYYYPFPAVSCKKSVHPIVAQVVPLISEEMNGAAVSLTVKG